MIRTDAEYQEAVGRLEAERDRLATHEAELRAAGLSPDEVTRMMDPLKSFHLQLVEDVAGYDRLKRGEFDDLNSLGEVGHLLIAARIARGVTQRELAKRLGVHESQVSRDERNEYYGVTLDRAGRILDALGVKLRSSARLAS